MSARKSPMTANDLRKSVPLYVKFNYHETITVPWQLTTRTHSAPHRLQGEQDGTYNTSH